MGIAAPIVVSGLRLISNGTSSFTTEKMIVLLSTTITTANVANLILGSVMCMVVGLSRRFNINPDNVATPIAASLGDMITMGLMAGIAHLYYTWFPTWLTALILVVLVLLTPVWGYFARRNQYTHNIVMTGWFPILGSMFIANGGGWIMEGSIDRYQRVAALQPIVNGVCILFFYCDHLRFLMASPQALDKAFMHI